MENCYARTRASAELLQNFPAALNTFFVYTVALQVVTSLVVFFAPVT